MRTFLLFSAIPRFLSLRPLFTPTLVDLGFVENAWHWWSPARKSSNRQFSPSRVFSHDFVGPLHERFHDLRDFVWKDKDATLGLWNRNDLDVFQKRNELWAKGKRDKCWVNNGGFSAYLVRFLRGRPRHTNLSPLNDKFGGRDPRTRPRTPREPQKGRQDWCQMWSQRRGTLNDPERP
jgi:hypothetical protein